MPITFIKRGSTKLFQAFLNPIFLYVTLVGNAFLVTITAIVYWIEKDSNVLMDHYLKALWWGVATITTVGYGDIVPTTLTGRVLGILLMFTGTVLFITFTGLLVSHWMQDEVGRELKPIENEIKKEERMLAQTEQTLVKINQRLDRIEGMFEEKNK